MSIETLLASLAGSIITIFIYSILHYLKKIIDRREEDKITIKENKRTSYKNLLDKHIRILIGTEPSDWTKEFSKVSIDILLWASDGVLREYGKYIESREKSKIEIQEHEIYFAKAILAYRKELGFKNRRGKITPKQIVLIFRLGYDRNIR